MSQEDYLNIYTHNTLLTLLRTDTEEEGQQCSKVSNVIACSVMDMSCDSGIRCRLLADTNVEGYMNLLQSIKPAYDWYIGVYDRYDYEVYSFGNDNIPELRTKKWSASEAVYHYIGTVETVYNVRLMLARND